VERHTPAIASRFFFQRSRIVGGCVQVRGDRRGRQLPDCEHRSIRMRLFLAAAVAEWVGNSTSEGLDVEVEMKILG